MLSVNQVAKSISTYSADVFGVASALFELGGMTVIHDASGCNSTYTTHDEPRWFDMESMVFISAVSEIEALMGDDEKLFRDIEKAAEQLKPRFIAIAGTPIPMMTGFDFDAAAMLMEERTGIPCFGFKTSGMEDYSVGISMALEAFAGYFPVEKDEISGCSDKDDVEKSPKSLKCNVIGLTPLDFSLNGSVKRIREFMEENGFEVISTWAMETDLEEMKQAGIADVNLVVSSSGLAAARVLKNRFGTPYVCGLPVGESESERLLCQLKNAAEENCCNGHGCNSSAEQRYYKEDAVISIIGEPVQSKALAACIYEMTGRAVKYICPLPCDDELLAPNDISALNEVEIEKAVEGSEILIADPLYKPVLPKGCRFVAMPHEAFSGRMFSDTNVNLIKNYDVIVKEIRR